MAELAYEKYWEVRVRQTFPSTDEVLNVYHFGDSDSGAQPGTVLDDLVTALVTNIKAAQHTSLRYTTMDCINLKTLIESGTKDISTHLGAVSGDASLRFIAWGVKFPRMAVNMRHGYKRYCGVAESSVSAGVPIAGISTMFSGTIVPGLLGLIGGHLTFLVLKRIKYTTPGGNDAWRTPRLDDTFEGYEPSTGALYGVTTQNTRKR